MPYPALECGADILRMFDELAENRAKILERCQHLSTEQLHDPIYPGTWSVLKNLAHLAWAEELMLAWIRKRPDALLPEERPIETVLELPAIRTALDESHAAAIALVKAHPPEVLQERCQFGRAGEQTVGGVLFHIIEHEIHHRGFILHKLKKLEGK